MKQCAYTLIELIIVVAILLLLALFGLPAFTKYRQISEFNQKSVEVKELLESAHAMAQSPANGQIYSYKVLYNSSSDPDQYSLVSCLDIDCTSPATVVEVSLLTNETIQIPQGVPPDGEILTCYTGVVGSTSTQCVPNPAMLPVSFRDDNDKVGRLATFTFIPTPFRLTSPFRADVSYSEL